MDEAAALPEILLSKPGLMSSWSESNLKASSPDISLDKMPLAMVPVKSLVITDSPRLSGESTQHIKVLAEKSAEFPPIVVHRPTMRVLDGIHRLRAAMLRGERDIAVRFFDGDEASAFVLAVKTNITHGLPLSLDDRKAAALRIVELYPEWSDRRIASVTGLAHGTVAAVRVRATSQSGQSNGRVGRDGRLRPGDIADRRERAAQLILENPEASLRAIAKHAGISPATARDVRARLSQDYLAGPDDHAGARLEQAPQPAQAAAPAQAVPAPRRPPAQKEPAFKGDAALRALLADPAFRSTENGRVLLRLLSTYRIIEDQGNLLISNSPPHCIDRLAVAAQACARVWQEFANQIDSQKEALQKTLS